MISCGVEQKIKLEETKMNEMVCEEKRDSQVRKQMEHMEKEIERSIDLFKRVYDRFSIVLMDAPTCGEKCDEEKPVEQLAPLANELRTFVLKMQNVSTEYEYMLSKVEL